MIYKVCKMEARKDRLPSFCDITKENKWIFCKLMDLYMGTPDYEIVFEYDDEKGNLNDAIVKVETARDDFCLSCVHGEHDKDILRAFWIEWASDEEDGFSIIESYVDNGTIFYDYADWDTSVIGILNGEPIEIYDKENDLTLLLHIDEDRECQFSGDLKRIACYSGFPNECITNAIMENRRNEEEADTGFLR